MVSPLTPKYGRLRHLAAGGERYPREHMPPLQRSTWDARRRKNIFWLQGVRSCHWREMFSVLSAACPDPRRVFPMRYHWLGAPLVEAAAPCGWGLSWSMKVGKAERSCSQLWNPGSIFGQLTAYLTHPCPQPPLPSMQLPTCKSQWRRPFLGCNS